VGRQRVYARLRRAMHGAAFERLLGLVFVRGAFAHPAVIGVACAAARRRY
jgi:hypothetical protein